MTLDEIVDELRKLAKTFKGSMPGSARRNYILNNLANELEDCSRMITKAIKGEVNE